MTLVAEAPSRPFSPDFGIIIEGEQATVMSYARRLARNIPDAEDLFQDACLRSRDKLNPQQNVAGYLFRAVRGAYIDRGRKLGHELSTLRPMQFEESDAAESIPSLDPLDDPEQCAIRRELSEVVQRALGTIPSEQRQVILLSSGGMSHSEISKALAIPEGTIKTRISAGRAKLREHQELQALR